MLCNREAGVREAIALVALVFQPTDAIGGSAYRERMYAASSRNWRSADLAHTLVPLPLALETIYLAVYGKPGNAREHQARLDGLASAVSVLVPLYEYAPQNESDVRQLDTRELEGGIFRDGGRSLTYKDARRPVRDLAISSTAIQHVVQMLAGVHSEDPAFTPP